MYRTSLVIIAALGLTACSSPHGPYPPPSGDGDLRYLLSADPASVTTADLLARAVHGADRIKQFHVVDGIYWQAMRSDDSKDDPDIYGSGGDSMIFSGIYLSSCIFRYGVTKSSDDLALVADAVRGLYILTHVSGTPGVLMRCAFPSDRAADWDYPRVWQSRIARGFVYDSPENVADPFNPGTTFAKRTFYTRATRDQVSGLLYGLSVLWSELRPELAANDDDKARIVELRSITATIINDVWNFLRQNDFRIVDQTGRNDTSADTVDDLLKLQLLAIYRKTVDGDVDRIDRIEEKYQDAFDTLRWPGYWPGDLFNAFSNGDQYYSWNLRFMRATSVWLLATPDEKTHVVKYMWKYLYAYVKNHQNAFFDLMYATAGQDLIAAENAVRSIKSWSIRPIRGWCSPLALGWNPGDEHPGPIVGAAIYMKRVLGLADDEIVPPHLREPTTYFVWDEAPWDVGVTYPNSPFDGAGVDYQIVYWMARYYGFLD